MSISKEILVSKRKDSMNVNILHYLQYLFFKSITIDVNSKDPDNINV
jgi:hypothetical protein